MELRLKDRTIDLDQNEYEELRTHFKWELAREEASKQVAAMLARPTTDAGLFESLQKHREAYTDALASHVPGVIECILRQADEDGCGLFMWAEAKLMSLWKHEDVDIEIKAKTKKGVR